VSITITIGIPHKALSPNEKPHWAAKAKKVKAARSKAWLLAQTEIVCSKSPAPQWVHAISTVVWYSRTKRRPDPDNANAMLKPTFDGMCDAGVVLNDKNLYHNPPRFEVDKQNPRVEVTISVVVENKEQP
jgi:Holliday junction resolvase RusA-like endonuclease